MIGVIGGSGFLGSSIIRELSAKNLPVHCFDISSPNVEVPFLEFDVTCSEHGEVLEGCGTIINLAAVHRDDVRPFTKYFEVNVEGARNVCVAASNAGVNRIVFTSSVAIYGFAPANTDESGTPNYFNEYGRTKYLAESIYREWQAEDPQVRSLVIVRPTVIFGPGNRGNVYNLLRQIAAGRFVMFGDGRNVKSMAYVENVAQFLLKCTAASPGVHLYNYVDKPDLSMNELVKVARDVLFNKSGVGLRFPGFLGVIIGKSFDFLAWITRRSFPVSGIRVKKFMATTQFSSAASDTGFIAPYSLSEGLEKTLRYEFLEDNQHKPTYETE